MGRRFGARRGGGSRIGIRRSTCEGGWLWRGTLLVLRRIRIALGGGLSFVVAFGEMGGGMMPTGRGVLAGGLSSRLAGF